MSEAQDGDRAIFEQFKELYSQTRSEEGTGDASLDVLLRTLKPALSHFVEVLAVPHWFNDELVTELARDGSTLPQEGSLAAVLELPFVRPHPRGFTYHDVVREVLRRSLVRKAPDEIRRLARRLAEIFSQPAGRDGSEEIGWERVYHTLAYDERAGFEAFDALFMQARRNHRLTVCDTLLHMATEQRALLSPEGGPGSITTAGSWPLTYIAGMRRRPFSRGCPWRSFRPL
jgi:hypothetical protein